MDLGQGLWLIPLLVWAWWSVESWFDCEDQQERKEAALFTVMGFGLLLAARFLP